MLCVLLADDDGALEMRKHKHSVSGDDNDSDDNSGDDNDGDESVAVFGMI